MEAKFSSYLMKILEEEKIVELHRQNLAKIIHFSPYSVFKYLDKSNKGFINYNDFKRFLNSTATRFNERNLSFLFRHFDRDRDNYINYNEFLTIILPQNDYQLRTIVSQRTPVIESILNYHVEQAFLKLLEKELNCVDTFYFFSLDVKSSYNFSLTKLFELLDYFKTNYIDAKGLEIFLKLNGYFISPTEINHLIFRLDKDGDGRITFTEFEEIFFLNDSVTNVQQDESFFTKSYNKRLEDNSGKYNNLLRGSYNDLNLRASMRTYTSPVRERRINYSQDLASLSLSKNMTSQERIISPLRESVNTSQNIQSLSLRNSYTYGKSNNLSNSLRISKPNFYTKSDLLSRTFENASNTRSSTLRTSSQPKDDLGYYLFKYFKDVIELEINLEGNKERFSLQPDVTVSNLYKIFDKEFCGSISMFQMRDNLLGLDVFVNIDEVKLLFKRYNSSNSGKFRYNMKNNISYNDFSEMILPQKYEYSKLIQRREISSTSSLSYDTRFKFSNLLKTIIENEKNVELFRKLLNANIFFNSIKAFNLIKPKYRDYITITDLQLFFRMNSVNVLGAEVELLFRRLDKNRDGVVSCQEVMNNLKLVPSRNPILEQIPK